MIAPTMPTARELEPFLAKLRDMPESVVIVAITWSRDHENFARVGIGHFSADARKRLKRALSAEKRRLKAA